MWKGSRQRRLEVRGLLVWGFGALALSGACVACTAVPWTARVCAANPSGNCRGVDNQPHSHEVTSTEGVTDVSVKDDSCANGIGALDVKVVDSSHLEVTIHCLVDAPQGTMTLAPAPSAPQPAPSAPPTPAPAGGQ